MGRLGLFLLVSLTIHVLILMINFPEKKVEKKEPVPVYIIEKQDKKVVKKQSEKKTKQVVKKETSNKQVKNKEVVKKDSSKQANIEKNKAVSKVKQSNTAENKSEVKKETVNNSNFKPKGADDPLVLPDIVVPSADINDKPEISVPDIPKIADSKSTGSSGAGGKNGGSSKAEEDLSKEIETLSQERSKDDNKNKTLSAEGSEKSIKNSSMYQFDISPKGNRRLTYTPPEPEFALSNDTSVTLKFNIDSQGNIYNIVFVTRSSSEIETIAYNYVKQMKFDAVLDNRDDFAQITLFFKVR